MKKLLITTTLIASLGLASTPARADGDDIVKILGAILIFSELFDKDDRRHYPHDGYPGYPNGGVYDDTGRYERSCNDNLGCASRDYNRWNDPRRYGYAQGRNGYGQPNGRVCGQRAYRLDEWTTRIDHLDCNGNIMFSTHHRR